MKEKKENKVDWRQIVLTIILQVVLQALLIWCIKVFTLEDAKINVSNSVKVNDEYYTTISIKNFKGHTIEDVSLYLDNKYLITEIIGEQNISLKENYIKVGYIPPKKTFSFIIKTKNELYSNCMAVESSKKITIDYTQNDIQTTLLYIVVSAICIITAAISTAFILVKDQKERIKIAISLENKIKDIEKESKDLIKNNEHLNKRIIKLEKNIIKNRIYLGIRLRDLNKELSFWRDTIRKLMYNSKNNKITSKNIINTVTKSLKTYTTNEKNNDNIDEIFYLANILKDEKLDEEDNKD